MKKHKFLRRAKKHLTRKKYLKLLLFLEGKKGCYLEEINDVLYGHVFRVSCVYREGDEIKSHDNDFKVEKTQLEKEVEKFGKSLFNGLKKFK